MAMAVMIESSRGPPWQCRQVLTEVWTLGSNTTDIRHRDGGGAYCNDKPPYHMYKLLHAPHTTATVVLNGQCCFSTIVLDHRRAYVCGVVWGNEALCSLLCRQQRQRHYPSAVCHSWDPSLLLPSEKSCIPSALPSALFPHT